MSFLANNNCEELSIMLMFDEGVNYRMMTNTTNYQRVDTESRTDSANLPYPLRGGRDQTNDLEIEINKRQIGRQKVQPHTKCFLLARSSLMLSQVYITVFFFKSI